MNKECKKLATCFCCSFFNKEKGICKLDKKEQNAMDKACMNFECKEEQNDKQ